MQPAVLPAPTGPHPVGMTTRWLRDESRVDPWVPGVRELMISLWYPATGDDHARYTEPGESEHFLRDAGIPGLPLDLIGHTRTHAYRAAGPPAPGLPLIVLSPGFTKPRWTLTSLAEDLASHGYAVVAVDHTYENVGTAFPDGRITTCLAREGRRGPEFWAKLAAGRAADVSFVLDSVVPVVDPAVVGMAGHSAGGASAPTAMVADPRIRAGVDIDGTTSSPLPESGLARPFLFLGKASNYTPGSGGAAATWERDWRRMTGWKRWLLVDGANHMSFTDVGLLAEQFGIGPPAARVSALTRRYVRAFFDQHLLDRPQPILDDPDDPEVIRCSPAPE